MGKKTNRAQRRTALPTAASDNSRQSRRTSHQVDGIAGLTEAIQKSLPKEQQVAIEGEWDNEEVEIFVVEPVVKSKEKKIITQNPVTQVKEAYNYAQFVGNKSTGTVTEISKTFIKIKTVNPINQQDITILAVGDTDFKEGNIVSFQFDVFRGKLTAHNPVIIGNDTVLTKLGAIKVPLVTVEYSANLKEEQLQYVTGKSVGGKFVVLNVGNS